MQPSVIKKMQIPPPPTHKNFTKQAQMCAEGCEGVFPKSLISIIENSLWLLGLEDEISDQLLSRFTGACPILCMGKI